MTSAEREFLAAIEAGNGELIPRPLSLHVCPPICTDANFARLERELDLVARLFDPDREVIKIEFGATALEGVLPTAKSELMRTMPAQVHFFSAFLDAWRESGPARQVALAPGISRVLRNFSPGSGPSTADALRSALPDGSM